jgi:nucleoside-diphosphate-sugar epimerase
MILVTGASGFIGSRLINSLLAGGIAVRGLAHSGKEPPIQHPLLEWQTGDICNRESLSHCFDNVETVVHLAAIIGATDEEINQTVNAEGTRTLIQLCRIHNVKRFILVSAAAVKYPHTNAYGRSKRRAEEIVTSSGLDYAILRLPLVIGPGSKEWERFVEYVRKIPLFVPVFGPGTAIKRPIYVGDAVSALHEIVLQQVLGNRVWEVACTEIVTLNELIDATCARLGMRKFKLHLPLGMSFILAGIMESFFGKKSPLTRDIVLGLNEDVHFNTKSSLTDLHLSPRSVLESIDASL